MVRYILLQLKQRDKQKKDSPVLFSPHPPTKALGVFSASRAFVYLAFTTVVAVLVPIVEVGARVANGPVVTPP